MSRAWHRSSIFVIASACAWVQLTITAFAGSPYPASRSIREWVKGDGKTDDARGVAAAFAATKNGLFTLSVDCPVFIHVGSDIARPIFVENGARVFFTEKGLFITDNVLIPAFVIANSDLISLFDWRIEYRGGIPVDPVTGGYFDNGRFIPSKDKCPAGAVFTDVTLTNWLVKNRGIVFDRSEGRVGSPWASPTNTSSIFYFLGSTRSVEVRDMKLFVPPQAGGNQFIPMCFSFTPGYNNNQTVTKLSPIDSSCCSAPRGFLFKDIDIDGSLMGFQGKVRDAIFDHVRSHRYADLQDKDGQNVGGVGKWFAPPHLFYLNFEPKSTGLENRNIHISDVIDYGNRVGTARDRRGDNPLSGYANSLKIGGFDSSVDHYISHRPDGLMDVLICDNLTISNVEATYDSSFLNDLFPGIRFPSPPYRHLTIENVTLVDLAPHPRIRPIGNSRDPGNVDVKLRNVKVTLNEWNQPEDLKPFIAGDDNEVDIRFSMRNK